MKARSVMLRLAIVVCSGLVAACGKVDHPTPKGTKLTTWSRTSAVLIDTSAPEMRGKTHPLTTATIIGEPQKRTFSVRVADPEKKGFAFDIVIESAKVSWKEGSAERERWATLGTEITLTANEAFDIHAKCDDKIAYVLGAPGEVSNTVIDCSVTGKRPNSMGTKDAITLSAPMQIEGSGKLSCYGNNAVVEEKK